MFDIKGSKLIYNKAEIESIIIEADNVTIAFREGYAENDKFVGVGSDHIILKGETLTKFMAALDVAEDKFTTAAETVFNARKEPELIDEVVDEVILIKE